MSRARNARRRNRLDLDTVMRAHVAATIAVARSCMEAAAAHRPLTLPELQRAEGHWLDFAIKTIRENWTKQGLSPGTLDMFAGPIEAHYRTLFAEAFYDPATLATLPVGV